MATKHQQLLDITPCRFGLVIPDLVHQVVAPHADIIILSLVKDYLDYRRQYLPDYTQSTHVQTNFFAHWASLHGNVRRYTANEQQVIRQYVKSVYRQLDAIFDGTAYTRWILTETGEECTTALPVPSDYFTGRQIQIKSNTRGVRPQCFLVVTALDTSIK